LDRRELLRAHAVLRAEMERRGIEHAAEGPLDEGDVEFYKAAPVPQFDLPDEVVVTPDFVCVVGSVAEGREPGDLDVLIRAVKDGVDFLVSADNVELPVRKVLDPEKKGSLHWIFNASGPHSTYVPLFDLVLRRKPVVAMREVGKEK
ncbi:MAG: hypothetical protein Q8O76_13865, partial [Chloroflexota bacterium]|nr:hypothetical protein [Chloroflexota bacterium]